jgi:hypothetical protein
VAVAQVEDEFFVVGVTGQSAAAAFAGQSAPAGQRLLVLDVTVQNRGKTGEFFQTAEQLKVAATDGNGVAPHPATYAGVRRPAERVWVPAGERRSFQVVYAFPAAEARPRLAYSGVSLAKVLDLPPLEAATTVAGTTGAVGTTGAAGATTQPMAAASGAAGATTPGATPTTTRPTANVAVKPTTPMSAGAAAVKPKKDQLPVRTAAKQPHKAAGCQASG